MYAIISILGLPSVALLTSEEAEAFGARPPKPAPTPAPVKPPPTTTPAPSLPVDPSMVIRARWENGKTRDGTAWSQHVFAQLPVLGANLLARAPRDIANFCPNYSNLSDTDKKNFWVYLFSSISELESGFDTNQVYTEAFRDQYGNLVTSNGLLQLSIGDNGIYGCQFKSNADMFDPIKNLDCGLIIMNKLVGEDAQLAGKIGGSWAGGTRYWSTLRNAAATQIQSWDSALPICRK